MADTNNAAHTRWWQTADVVFGVPLAFRAGCLPVRADRAGRAVPRREVRRGLPIVRRHGSPMDRPRLTAGVTLAIFRKAD